MADERVKYCETCKCMYRGAKASTECRACTDGDDGEFAPESNNDNRGNRGTRK